MHLDDCAAARARVERVDVLRDDRGDEASPLELGQRPVRCVRLCVEEQLDPPAVEVPHALGIAPEGLNGCDLEGIDVGPDPTRRTEVRDAALRAHARPGQHQARLPLANESG